MSRARNTVTIFRSDGPPLKRKMTREDRRVVNEMGRIRNLLKVFGGTLWGYDPGVRFCLENGHDLDIGGVEWKWLEPLLTELKAYRRLKHTQKGGGMK